METNKPLVIVGVLLLAAASFVQTTSIIPLPQVAVFLAGAIAAFITALGLPSIHLTNPTIVTVGTALLATITFIQASPFAAQMPGVLFVAGLLAAGVTALGIAPPRRE